MDYRNTTVPAVRGRMGSTPFYTATFPFGIAVKILQFDPEQMPERVEERHQRKLDLGRAAEIAAYILDNEDFFFSSITVSVDASKVNFRESDVDPDVGVLTIPLTASWIVNDGQHRLAGIDRALRKNPDLEDELLSAVILLDPDLKRSQQVFSDLNRTAKRTSASLNVAFDHRSPLNRLTNEVVERVPLFDGRTDKENASLALRSGWFTTLSAVAAANRQLLDLDEHIEEAEFNARVEEAIEFWEFATTVVQPWERIAAGELAPSAARSDFLSSYAIALWAIGNLGRTAKDRTDDWQPIVGRLVKVDWRKSNPEWERACMQDGRVVTSEPHRKQTAQLLKDKVGLDR